METKRALKQMYADATRAEISAAVDAVDRAAIEAEQGARVVFRLWDGKETINGCDMLNHPTPGRSDEIRRILDGGGIFLVGEIDGRVSVFQDVPAKAGAKLDVSAEIERYKERVVAPLVQDAVMKAAEEKLWEE